MAFIPRVTIVCDHPDCPSEFSMVGNDFLKAEWSAERAGWFIVSQSGNEWTGYKPPTHYCPEHRPRK